MILSLVPKINRHEVPSYYDSHANNTTKGLRFGSIIFGSWSSTEVDPSYCQNPCAGVASGRKAITGVRGRMPLHAKNGVFVLRTFVDGFQSAVSPLKGPSTRLSEPVPPVRPLKEKEMGPFGELSTSNPRAEVPGVAPKVAPNVSAL